MQTNIYIFEYNCQNINNGIVYELSNSSSAMWLPQNVRSKIKRKHQIWPDIHKTNGAIVSVSLILCKFICQT